jgi:hypothetical protein
LAASIERRQRAISAEEAALLKEIAEFDRAESWRGDGALSMTAWLMGHCRIGPARARTLVGAATKVDGLPRLSDELSAGRLTLDVFAPLADAATPQSDAHLAKEAPHLSPKQARQLAAAARGERDADAVGQFKGRTLHLNDDKCTIWARFTKDGYARVKSALVGRARLHTHPSAADDDYEPFEARLADALVQICTEQGKRRGGPDSGSGSGSVVFGGTATTMVVHADLALLLEGDGHGYASIEGVGPISAEVARRLACDAKITLSVHGGDGSVLDQFPLRREPTDAQRIEIARRDQGCRFTGCPCTTVTDVHHIVWSSKGGPTVLSNLITLCTGHHSRIHELGWKMAGDANATVTFTSPHGKTISSVPSPLWRGPGPGPGPSKGTRPARK